MNTLYMYIDICLYVYDVYVQTCFMKCVVHMLRTSFCQIFALYFAYTNSLILSSNIQKIAIKIIIDQINVIG